MLNSLFTKSFNNSLSPLSFADMDSLKSTNEDDLEGILCHVQEVQHYLETLDTSKSNGCDGISARMLKSTAPSKVQYHNLFSKSTKTAKYKKCFILYHTFSDIDLHKSHY